MAKKASTKSKATNARGERDREWADDIYRVLKDVDVAQVSYVPDAGHKTLIERCLADNEIKAVRLTTEEEGVALATGAWMGGERSTLLMQSSGVGNCINMLSIVEECRVPLLILVTMRGSWGEFNPWQTPMGQGTREALEAANVIVQEVDRADELGEAVFAASQLAYNSYRAVAVLIGQRVIGFKDWRK